MTKTEAQTRQAIIDNRLHKAGWNIKDPSQVTEELDIYVGRPVEPYTTIESESKYGGHLFADYALLGRDGYPLAVVEAKKTSVDSRVGKEQARNYAEKIQVLNVDLLVVCLKNMNILKRAYLFGQWIILKKMNFRKMDAYILQMRNLMH